MRRFDKLNNIRKANLLSEQRYLETKGLLKEEPIEYPNSVTVKLTDEWKNSHDLYRVPENVKLPNNDEAYTYIGNTKLDGFSGTIYFASRKGPPYMTPERGGSKEGSRGEGYGGYISPPPLRSQWGRGKTLVRY
jgi:hypothetical protein